MPLIVYLHGGSGNENDLELITSVEGFPQFVKEGIVNDVPAYIVFPQLSKDKKGWNLISTDIVELINTLCTEYSIDKSNISLTGHSMGGTGSWDLSLKYPELFARVAPASGSVKLTDENI